MPPPPDLSSLFQQQTAEINAACEKAGQAFTVFKSRDQDVASLVQTLSSEVQKVLMIAAAAKSPELAIASIPPVLALANAAFATVPVTDQKTAEEIQRAFAPFNALPHYLGRRISIRRPPTGDVPSAICPPWP